MSNHVRYQTDWKARQFLAAAQYYGGEATMTEIRRSGLDRDAANHRFARLEELGLINVTRAERGHGRREPPKVAHLTGLARREIERDLLYDLQEPGDEETTQDILAELQALRQTVERLEQHINAMDVSVSLVDDDMQMLNNWLHNYVAEFEPVSSAFKAHLVSELTTSTTTLGALAFGRSRDQSASRYRIDDT